MRRSAKCFLAQRVVIRLKLEHELFIRSTYIANAQGSPLHFKPKPIRLRFVARLLDGEKMARLYEEFWISRKTGYKILERYKDIGLPGLFDRNRRPPSLSSIEIGRNSRFSFLAPNWQGGDS